MRILLVEPDFALALETERLLHDSDRNVFTTDLGEEAAHLVRRFDYDIMVLEPNTPDMPGLDVLDSLRKYGVRIPVLILSDPATVNRLSRGFGFGADGYLEKPTGRSDLIAAIDAAFRRFHDGPQTLITLRSQ